MQVILVIVAVMLAGAKESAVWSTPELLREHDTVLDFLIKSPQQGTPGLEGMYVPEEHADYQTNRRHKRCLLLQALHRHLNRPLHWHYMRHENRVPYYLPISSRGKASA